MAQQLILLGTQGTQSGSTVRTAFDYCNQNFTELYGWTNQGVKTTSSPEFYGLTLRGGTHHGGAVFQETDVQEGSIEIIPIIGQSSDSSKKLYFSGGQTLQWTIAGGGLNIHENTGDPILFLSTGSTSVGTKIWQDASSGDTYIDNLYNSDTGNIFFRTKVAGTALTPLTITGNGRITIARNGAYSPSATGQLFVGGIDTNKRIMIGYDTTNNKGFIEAINYGTAYSDLLLNPYSATVGIRTTSPLSDAALDVGGSTKVNAAIYPRVAITSNASRIESLQLQNLSTGTAAEMRFITAANDDTYLAFTQPGSANTGTFFGKTKSSGSFIFSNSRPLYIGTITAQEIGFGIGNVTKATIDTSGNFKTLSGDIQTGGTFKSSDGSSGLNYEVEFEDQINGVVHTVVVKDGLITSWDET